MSSTDQPTLDRPSGSPIRSHWISFVRIVLVLFLIPLLVHLCLQTDHARVKGMPLETWKLIPLITCAIVATLLGKRFLNGFAAVFLGGIGGVFGACDNLAGPYGGIVGLVVGMIVVTLAGLWTSVRESAGT